MSFIAAPVLAAPVPTAPVLIVSAFAPELAPLRASLIASDLSPDTFMCLPVGIGAVDAAAGAARALATATPRAIVFVGTAGRYGARSDTSADMNVGGVVIARGLTLVSTAVLRGAGYLPGPMVTAMRADAGLGRALARAARRASVTAPAADVATPLAITRSAALARQIAATTGAAVENLEAFAVARAAAAAGVPFGALLGISNRVGPRAHAEWLRYKDIAAAAACTVAQAYIAQAYVSQANVEATVPSRSARPRRRA